MYLDKYDFEYLNQIRKEIIEKYYGKIKTSQIPGVDNDKIIMVYPDLRREDQSMTMCEIEVRRRERKARRAKRPWWLRWY
jgi:hypothetical protein